MTATADHLCPRCGGPLPVASTEQLCPGCLLLQVMTDTEVLTVDAADGATPVPEAALPGVEDLPCDFGGYRLLRFLGRGGMGAAFEAEQTSTGRRVALKMLSQNLESAEIRGRFLREGRLAAGISHPNSLYVFGTEEIDGIPVITMEIADRGTLADQLQENGPLPVPEAVDVVLGLIAGLEAAQAAGVLHRDVKPSNVFVDAEGGVKVGDYGLSVSTVATIDSFATATGVVLGTPAYAAPEQLRGDEVDLRADIYSVGATLYSLLTDQAPIAGKNPVQIVAAVLDEKPKLLTELRRDVPTGLALVVARCLAKRPEQRFASYQALREALRPFSSEVPQPAPWSKRSVACVMDEFLASLVPGSVAAAWYGVGSIAELSWSQGWPLRLGLVLWYVAYFGLAEGRGGIGLGKRLIGLRVVCEDGRPVGYGRALLRPLLVGVLRYLAVLTAGLFASLGWGLVATMGLEQQRLLAALFWSGSYLCLVLAPLATMRRRNGQAVLWDLLTGTRVVERPERVERPLLDHEQVIGGPPETAAGQASTLGPYLVVQRLAADWVCAFDPTIRRTVWLRKRGDTPLAEARRRCARPGRARWLQEVVTSGEAWDVFEARPGLPLSDVLAGEQPPSWEAGCHWLYELTVEVAQASQDGTLPARLSFDQVWITLNGRAILLDDPWPQREVPAASIEVADQAGKQRFLAEIASRVGLCTVPLHARGVLDNLAAGGFEKLSFLAGCFRSLLNQPARIDRPLRAASLLGIPATLIGLTAVSVFSEPLVEREKTNALAALYPQLPPLNEVLRLRMTLEENDTLRAAVDTHLVSHYQYETFSVVDDDEDYQNFRLLTREERRELKQAVTGASAVTGAPLQQAEDQLADALVTFVARQRRETSQSRWQELGATALGMIWLLGLGQLLTLAVLGTTVGQQLFRIAVVNARGQPAGRVRLMFRWLLGWGPFFLLMGVAAWLTDGHGILTAVLLPFCCGGLVMAIVRPAQGLHDQLTGCYLVPR